MDICSRPYKQTLINPRSGVFGSPDFNVNLSTFEADANGDDVALLAEVPEPGTWAMMLAGMGMLVVLQRRRRRI